jgi:hypothetical protein
MIQKSELQIVPVEQRVPGRVYGVGDELSGELEIVRIARKDAKDFFGKTWQYWFALPESMLPVREVMPDEFELKNGEWELANFGETMWSPLIYKWYLRRLKKPLPSLTIPPGSKSEQIAELEKILAELKQS